MEHWSGAVVLGHWLRRRQNAEYQKRAKRKGAEEDDTHARNGTEPHMIARQRNISS